MADDVTKLPMDSSEQASPRQPPTVSDTTAAAFPSSTQGQLPSGHALKKYRLCDERIQRIVQPALIKLEFSPSWTNLVAKIRFL